MTTMSPTVELNDKIVKILRDLMISQKKKIKESFEITKKIEIGFINNFDITNVRKHKGFGGTTYVISANLSTSNHGTLGGGMVIKFPNNLEEEKRNAIALHQLCKKRQQQWDIAKKHEISPVIKSLPDFIFAPNVLETISIPNTDTSCLMLEFVDGAIPLIDSVEKGGFPDKLRLLGYSLARLHGPNSLVTNIEIYNPIFNHLAKTLNKDVLTNWYEICKHAHGSVEYIHGDSHLQNILKARMFGSQEAIAWIDAMLVETSDRMDDVGYAISYLIQHEVQTLYSKGTDPKVVITSISANVVNSWSPIILEAYNATVSTKVLYNYFPLDFFIGAHCVIRADLWDDQVIKWMLVQIGEYFVNSAPIYQSMI
jgi:hypothetical protein